MGEIFRREIAANPEPFTGERLTSAFGGQVQIEHYHRYLFARSRVAGLDVLDVASGEGYGSALLAQVARSVIGIEYSGPTVASAAANFPRSNLRFLQADARRLPLADASVNTVVSFETIEHFDRQDDFVSEVRRVLHPDGSFIVSTPDRDTYSPVGAPPNPFHVRELSETELVALLREHFRYVVVMRQRSVSGSALLTDIDSSVPPLVFDRRGDSHFEACTGLPRAPYVVAVASDCKPLPLPPSLYVDRSDLDTETQLRIALEQQLQQAKAQLALAMQRADTAVESAAQSKQHARDATQRAELATQHAELVEARLAELQQTHAALQGSARNFLRGYLPRLRAHLFGQRP